MTHRTLAATLAVALVASIAACGGGAAPSASTAAGPGDTAAPPQGGSSQAPSLEAPSTQAAASAATTGTLPAACDTLTDADFDELMGGTISKTLPNPQDSIYDNACQWEVERPDGTVLVTLGLRGPGGKALFEGSLKPYAEMAGDEPLAGVGDDALVSEFMNSVVVLTGDSLVDLQLVEFGLDWREPAIALAERVIENAIP